MANIFAQQITWIYTYDLASTARFYAEALGLEEVLDQGMCRIFRATTSSFIGVCQRPDRDVEPKGVILNVTTKDVDGWRKRMGDYGARILTEPSYSERAQAYAFFCLDPEGYRIEFQEFRDPRWQWPTEMGGFA